MLHDVRKEKWPEGIAGVIEQYGGCEDSMCGLCFSPTKYTCLPCGNFFWMRCSVFEEDEETPDWKAGRSVARCEACFREKLENEVNEREFDQDSETKIRF